MTWSRKWPTEPGFYWFYGRLSSSERAFGICRVPTIGSVVVFVTDKGVYVHREGEVRGFFKRIREPSKPRGE